MGSGPLIAVVDDDTSLREALSGLLSAYGYRIDAYASGHDLLASPKLALYALFILDVQMPVIDGLQLQAELLEAGAHICGFAETLPAALRERYAPAPGDEDLALLHCRRATFEYVMRGHVGRLAGVEIVSHARVTGLVARRKGELLVVRGLECERAGVAEKYHADITIDASGRSSQFPNWLRSEGVSVGEESVPAGILYFTRHYRFLAGRSHPSLDAGSLGGDLGYLKYGICPADNGHFSITLAVPEGEQGLRHAILEPAKFDSLCAQIPSCALWTDPDLAEPVSQVLPMANLTNLWRSFLKQEQPQLLGFFAIGDAAIRTNPLYGRGCSAGFAHAQLLRDVIEESEDPARRAVMLEEQTRALFRPYYEISVRQDHHSIERARQGDGAALSAAASKTSTPKAIKARLKRSLIEHGLSPAMQGDINVVRAQAHVFHMLDPPISWTKRPALLARILWMWAMPRAAKQRLYGPAPGPSREQLLTRVCSAGAAA